MKPTTNNRDVPVRASNFKRRLLPAAIIAAGQVLASAPAISGPEGGRIIHGDGGIDHSDRITTITQNSDRIVINWDDFNVDSDEVVNYLQPDIDSIALNQILSHNGSEIHGRINANGQVVLINPHGVLFGENAKINVGGMIASGLSINTDDFVNGDFTFSDLEGAEGKIVNQGLLQAATGGSISLIGKSVKNEGLISAELGAVNLAAGKEAVVTFDNTGLMGVRVTKEILQSELGVDAALVNDGNIEAAGGRILLTASTSRDIFSQAVNTGDLAQASSVVMHEDGSFTLGAGADVVNTGNLSVSNNAGSAGKIAVLGENVTHRGTIQADAIGPESAKAGKVEVHAQDTTLVVGEGNVSALSESANGGQIALLGEKVGLADEASVVASGVLGGGDILIGGDYKGRNEKIRNSASTYVGPDTTLKASALTDGDGGRVIVWADDITRYFGHLEAVGKGRDGSGGFAEVSGKDSLRFKGTVDLSGLVASGTLLLDPRDITIVGEYALGAEDLSESEVTFERDGDDSISISAISISNLLYDENTGSGANVILQATRDILFEHELLTSEANSSNLTLLAGDDIRVRETAELELGQGDIYFYAGVSTCDPLCSSSSSGGIVTLEGRSIRIESLVDTGGTISLHAADHVSVVREIGQNIAPDLISIKAGQSINVTSSIRANGPLSDGSSAIQLIAGDVTLTEVNEGFEQLVAPTADNDNNLLKTIDISAPLNSQGGDITLNAPEAITLSANIETAGGNIFVGSDTSLAGSFTSTNAFLNTSSADKGGDITIRTSGDVAFGGASFGGTSEGSEASIGAVDVNSELGDITLEGSFTYNSGTAGAVGSIALTAGTGNVTLSDVDFDNGALAPQELSMLNVDISASEGDVTLNDGSVLWLTGGHFHINESSSISLDHGTLNTQGGDVRLSSDGAVTLANDVFTTGGDFTVTGSGSFTSLNKNIETSSYNNAGDIDITSDGAITLGSIRIGVDNASEAGEDAIGDLTIESGGIVSSSGNLRVNGTTTLTSNLAFSAEDPDFTEFTIDLANDNEFLGSLAINSEAGARVRNTLATDLGLSNISGNLALTSGGALTGSDVVSVGGTTVLNAMNSEDNAQAISLGDQAHQFTGLVTINAASSVTLKNRGSLKVDSISTSGGYTSNGGDISLESEEGALTVSELTADGGAGYQSLNGGNGGAITLSGSKITLLGSISSNGGTEGRRSNEGYGGNITLNGDVELAADGIQIDASGRLNADPPSGEIEFTGGVVSDVDEEGQSLGRNLTINAKRVTFGGAVGKLVSGEDPVSIEEGALGSLSIESQGDVAFGGHYFPTASSISIVGSGASDSTLSLTNTENTWAINRNRDDFTQTGRNTINDLIEFSGFGVLNGGSGNDHFALNVAGTEYTVSGSSGANQISANYASDNQNVWTVSGDGSESYLAHDGRNIEFTGIQTINGSSESDRLIGPNAAATWTVVEAGTGTLAETLAQGSNEEPAFSYQFSGMDDLEAGNSVNIFAFNQANASGEYLGAIDLITGSGDDTLIGRNEETIWTLGGDSDPSTLSSGETGYVGSFTGMSELLGGDAKDDFVVSDGATFGVINGGGGANTLEYLARAEDFTITVGSSDLANVQNIQTLYANSDENHTATLAVESGENDWFLNNEAEVDSRLERDSVPLFEFSGFSAVLGGSDIDTFQLVSAASVKDITGGGGEDIIISNHPGATWTLTGSNSGSLRETYEFESIEELRGSGSDRLIGADYESDWDLISTGAGTVTYGAEALSFSGMSHLTGGSREDTFTPRSRDAEFTLISGGTGDENHFDISGITEEVVLGLGIVADSDWAIENFNTLSGSGASANLVLAHGTNNWTVNQRNGGSITHSPVGSTEALFTGPLNFTGFDQLTGGAGNEHFDIVDAGSVSGGIKGGAGNLNQLQVSGGGSRWHVSADDQGYVTDSAGSTLASFESIDLIVATNSDDHLIGSPGGNNVWTIDEANGGSVTFGTAGIDFQGMDRLVGADQKDDFILESGGEFTGELKGNGGQNSLRSFKTNNTWQITSAHKGTLNDNIDFEDIQTLYGVGIGDRLIGPDVNTDWTLSGTRSGSMVLAGNQATSTTFSGMWILEGGTGRDQFNFLDGSTVTMLRTFGLIDGGAGESDSLNLTGITDGQSLSVAIGTLNSADINILNIETLDANNSGNVLYGPDSDTRWTLTATDAGRFEALNEPLPEATTTFSGFAQLWGGEGDDTFNLSQGEVSESIDGGEGFNWVDYSGFDGDLCIAMGAALEGCSQLSFTNIQGVIGNNDGSAGSGYSTRLEVGNADEEQSYVWSLGELTDVGQAEAGNDGVNDGVYNQSGADEFYFLNVNELIAGAGRDEFLFDSTAQFLGRIDAGAGDNIIDASQSNRAQHFSLRELEQSDASGVWLSGFNEFVANDNAAIENRLTGSAEGSNWLVDGIRSGDVDGATFKGFSHLVGGADGADQFEITYFGSVLSIDGVASENTLSLASGANATVVWTVTGNSGTLSSNRLESFDNIVHLEGGAGEDRFYLDTRENIQSIDGGTGENWLSISSTENTWTMLGDFEGVVTAGDSTGQGLSFNGIHRLLGSGSDSLQAVDETNLWRYSTDADWTLENAGDDSNQIRFSGMSSLLGGSETDHFELLATGLPDVTLSGGSDAGNKLSVSSNETWNLTSATSGTLSDIVSFEQIQQFLSLGDDASAVLTGLDSDTRWLIDEQGRGRFGALDGEASSYTEFVGFDHLIGGNGRDDFYLETDENLNFFLDGGAGSNSLYGADRSNVWDIGGANNLNGAVSFENIQHFIGHDDTDSFTLSAGTNVSSIRGFREDSTSIEDDTLTIVGNSSNSETEWLIKGANEGEVSGRTQFYDIDHLVGSDVDDRFHLQEGGALSGSIDGQGGENHLLADAPGNLWTLNEEHAGSLTQEGGAEISFEAIQEITGGGDDTLQARADQNNLWHNEGGNSWTLAENIVGASDSVLFRGIQTWIGGDENDTFMLSSDRSIKTISGGTGDNSLSARGDGEWVLLTHSFSGTLDESTAFTNIRTLAGEDGHHTLTGLDQANLWRVTDATSGTVSTPAAGEAERLYFNGISELIGRTKADEFRITHLEGYKGSIHGGEGKNTLSSLGDGHEWVLSEIDQGLLNGYIFTDISVLIGVGENHRLTGMNQNANWMLTGAHEGELALQDDLTASVEFQGMKHLVGGQGDDVFEAAPGLTAQELSAFGTILGGDRSSGDDGENRLLFSDISGDALTLSLGTHQDADLHVGAFNDIRAHDAANTLRGDTDTAYRWLIDGSNSGELAWRVADTEHTLRFANFGNLYGGDSSDSFSVDGGRVSGVIDGLGGINLLDLSRLQEDVIVSLDGAGDLGEGLSINISNINGVIGNHNPDDPDSYNSTFQVGSAGRSGENYQWNLQKLEDLEQILESDGVNDGRYRPGTDYEVAFVDFNILKGSAGNDSFRFYDQAEVTGSIDGVGGNNRYDARAADRAHHLTLDTSSDGKVRIETVQTLWANDQYLNSLSAAGRAEGNAWHVSADQSGQLNSSIVFEGFGHLIGSTQSDDFVLEGDGRVQRIEGGGARESNTLILDNLSGSLVASLDLNSDADLLLSEVGEITSEGTEHQLQGGNRDNIWQIDAENAGRLNDELVFKGFAHLVGNAKDDTFRVHGEGGITGSVDGGAGGSADRAGSENTVDLRSLAADRGLTLAVSEREQADLVMLNIDTLRGSVESSQESDENPGHSLMASDQHNDWLIKGENEGELNTLKFFGIANLVGGSRDDHFRFEAGASLSGQLDGGDRIDENILDVSSLGIAEVSFGQDGQFKNIDYLKGNNSNTTLRGLDPDSIWRLNEGQNSGTLNDDLRFTGVTDLVGGDEGNTFYLTGGTVTGSLTGGAATDRFELQVLAGVAGSLTLNGAGAEDELLVTGGGSGYEARYDANQLSGERLVYTDPEANVYEVAFSDIEVVQDQSLANSLRLNTSLESDQLTLQDQSYQIDGFTQLGYSNKANLIIAASSDDRLTIAGSLNLSGTLEIRNAQVDQASADHVVRAQELQLVGVAQFGSQAQAVRTSVNRLSADVGAGGLFLRDEGALTLGNINSRGLVELSAAGSITSDSEIAGSNGFRLHSDQGGIELSGRNRLGGAVELFAGNNIRLNNQRSLTLADVQARNLTLNVQGEIDAVGSVATGSLYVEADGNVNFLNEQNQIRSLSIARAEDAQLTSRSAMIVEELQDAGHVTLKAAGLQFDGASDVRSLTVDSGEFETAFNARVDAQEHLTVEAQGLAVDARLEADGISLDSRDGRLRVSERLEAVGAEGIDLKGNSIEQTAVLTSNGVISANADKDIEQRALLRSESGLNLVAGGSIWMDSDARTQSDTGRIFYQAGHDLSLSQLENSQGSVELSVGNKVINVLGDQVNVVADRLEIQAGQGVGDTNRLTTQVRELHATNDSGAIALENTGDLRVERLASNGRVSLRNIGSVELDAQGSPVFDRNDANALTAGGTASANYDVGALSISISDGNLTATGQANGQQPDLVARSGSIVVGGNIGAPDRQLVMYFKDDLFIQGLRSWSPIWAFGAIPPQVDNQSSIQFNQQDLQSAGGEQMVELESLEDIDPAIFTEVRNYSYDEVSILLPPDQRYDDDDEDQYSLDY